MTETTIQYRLNLPSALLPISPALSALHTSRAAALHPELAAILLPTHCRKCGTYRFTGDHPPTRKKRKRARSSRSKCHLCGFSVDASSLDKSSHLLNDRGQSTDTLLPIAAGPTTTSVPVPPRQSHPKSNHAKVSTLKDMLSRSHQREESARHKKKQVDHEGLASFLKKL